MSRRRKRRNERLSQKAQEIQEAQEEQELLAKLVPGYSNSYYSSQLGHLPRMIFQIPGNVAQKLADPVLLQHEWARSILLDNKRFVVIYADERVSVVIYNHDGELSFIVIDKNKTMVPGLRNKLKNLPEVIVSMNGSGRDFKNIQYMLLHEMRQWQTVMEVPADVAKYWLRTSGKELLSYDRKNSWNHLKDERSFCARLFRRPTVMVARSDEGEDLALKQENGRFFLQVRLWTPPNIRLSGP
jgi:hypothetical protein